MGDEIQPGSRRRWIFRLAAVVGVPCVVLFAIEIGLRLTGFGHPASFVVPCNSAGIASFCDNPDFSRTFFPREMARPPVSFSFPAVKPPATIRVFVVGASAAQGDPDPTYGPARMLELLLAERYPGMQFEVVNAAVTAINSHVVLPIVRELAAFEPDLFIVYLGNNEVVGPYGAGTVFAPLSASWPLIRASILARETRMGQLVARMLDRTAGETSDWRGMEMFVGQRVVRDDPRMGQVHAHFATNLRKVVESARLADARVILTTVPTNLADCAPFASVARPGLEDAERIRRDERVRVGDLRLAEGDLDSALASYREAERVDETMAELQFRIGKLRQQQSRSDLARERLTLARDLDALRFRADSEINETIRAIAGDANDAGVAMADAERRFQAVSPQGLPGHSLFLEHVHPTFSGNYLIALTWLEQAGAVFPESQPDASGAILSEDELARRLAYSPFDRKRLWSTVARRLSRPPFTDQFDHDEQLRRVRERIERFAPTRWGEVLGIYEDALAARPDDPWLRHNLATVLGQIGEHDRAAVELHAFLEAFPRDPSGRERLCETEAERREFDNALAECGRLIQLLPYYASPRYTMAYSLASLGRFDDAIAVYDQLLTIDPGSTPQILNEIGRIEMHRSRFEAAIAVYREALDAADSSADPLIPDLRFNYASALRAAGQEDQAVRAYAGAADDYRRVIELDPASVAPRLALARCLSELGLHDEAERVRREAHRLETQLPE